jgi:hypothetical protein
MTASTPNRYGSDLVVDLMNQYELLWIALNPGGLVSGAARLPGELW